MTPEREKTIKGIIADKLGIFPEDRVTSTAHLVNDLGADSLDAIELIMALEDSFEIGITDEEAEAVKTVQHIIDLVDKKKVPDGKK